MQPITKPFGRTLFAVSILLFFFGGVHGAAVASAEAVQITGVSADGKNVVVSPDGLVELSAKSRVHLIVNYGPRPGDQGGHRALRNLHQFEGFDRDWVDDPGYMRLDLQFFDEKNRVRDCKQVRMDGKSSLWQGTVADSEFTLRRVRFTPPQESRFLRAALFSGGPRATVGVLCFASLRIYRLPGDGARDLAADWSVTLNKPSGESRPMPKNWMRFGENTALATAELVHGIAALVIRDDDPDAYASWELAEDRSLAVEPGVTYEAVWQEMYSVGSSGANFMEYDLTSPGKHRFKLLSATIEGIHAGSETVLTVVLPLPMTQRPWFLVLCGCIAASGVFGVWRYVESNRARLALAQARQQRAVEQERVRIARDIHDDLGAELATIAMLGELAESDVEEQSPARPQLSEIRIRARDTVRRLEEIVWAINPANDTVQGFAHYFCRAIQNYLEVSGVRSRFDLPATFPLLPLESSVRHNLFLAAKEAVHNAVYHGRPKTVTVRISIQDASVILTIEDDGCGFIDSETLSARHGSANMRQRVEQAGGCFCRESTPGQGTTVVLSVPLRKAMQSPI